MCGRGSSAAWVAPQMHAHDRENSRSKVFMEAKPFCGWGFILIEVAGRWSSSHKSIVRNLQHFAKSTQASSPKAPNEFTCMSVYCFAASARRPLRAIRLNARWPTNRKAGTIGTFAIRQTAGVDDVHRCSLLLRRLRSPRWLSASRCIWHRALRPL